MNALEHVGSRIRLYRKMKNMTIGDLSSELHVGTSTISKYENGKIAIDINTLFEIARILEVNINQLVDYKDKSTPSQTTSYSGNFFKRSDVFFLYQYWGREKKIYVSAIEIIPDPLSDNTDNVLLYFDIENENDHTKCDYLYSGTIAYSDSFTHIMVENMYNSSDKVFIIAKTSFQSKGSTTGLMNAISQSVRNPYAVKVIISPDHLTKDDELINLLLENDKETIQELKRSNALIIY